MKNLFDRISVRSSKMVTRAYSTSFSLGIYFLNGKFHDPIYSIYGFVRLADEIVDSFHDYDKEELLKRFRTDTQLAIDEQISLNPILNSFQKCVHQYKIEQELIDTFLHSMEMDLTQSFHDKKSFDNYILGSAEVVGLMCLRVFTEGNNEMYEKLKPAAMYLGAAFQKVNFLRDLKQDYNHLGRAYFPGIDLDNFDYAQKVKIESDIESDFTLALNGIKNLPKGARLGVYVAFVYYKALFAKIKSVPAERVMRERIRVPNNKKFRLLINSVIRHQFNML